MKTLKKFLLIPLFAVVCMFARIDSAAAVDYPFSVTTSSIAANGTFQFILSAKGTFYVDCGTGGTLSSDDSTANGMISGGTINKTDTTKYTFKCTYSSAGTKTIRFGGTATQYNTSTSTTAISFYTTAANAALITSISGDLSLIFPYISASSGKQPRFYQTFSFCTNLTSIPENLFSHITGGATYMFYYTFYGCTGLTSIPENLFSFGGKNVSGQNSMFYSTFYGCTGLTSIPANLFSHVRGGASSLFSGTFLGCRGLTSIPENLFSHITGGASSLFSSTFYGCSGLTSIPANLFSHITSAANSMFYQTFSGCTGLTGYIPPSMFSGLIANGSPYASNMMYNIFYNTGSLRTTCPSGTTQYTTGYEDYWDSHVSCFSNVPISCSSGYYLPACYDTCATCPSGATCPGGTFTFNQTMNQGTQIGFTWYDGNTQMSGGPSSCTAGGLFLPPTPPARTGYVFNGWKVIQKCGIPSLDTSINGINNGFRRLNGSVSQASTFGITINGQWAVEFSYGTVWGMANCNSVNGGSSGTVATITPESSGLYCWCQATGFTASNGNSYASGPQCTTSASNSWVYRYGHGTTSDCEKYCAGYCALLLQNNVNFRTAVFGAVGQ